MGSSGTDRSGTDTDHPHRTKITPKERFLGSGQQVVGRKKMTGTDDQMTTREKKRRSTKIQRRIKAIEKNIRQLEDEGAQCFFLVEYAHSRGKKFKILGRGEAMRRFKANRPLLSKTSKSAHLAKRAADVHQKLVRQDPSRVTPKKVATPCKGSFTVGSGGRMAKEQMEELQKMTSITAEDDEIIGKLKVWLKVTWNV